MRDGFRERGATVTRMEAFVDAAFAFAVTLLIISIDSIPDSIDDLIVALKGIPAFAASFAVLALFWRGHAAWSRRYGLDDGASTLLGLLLVFLVLVFVYPLKMLFASGFNWASGGALPAGFVIDSLHELQWLYWVYAAAFGLLGGNLALLTWHAWRRRDALQLDAEEQVSTRVWLASWLAIPLVAALSAVLAALLPARGPGWTYALPPMCYALLGLQAPLLTRYERRLRRSLQG
jgi:uncharacterized membrane protein